MYVRSSDDFKASCPATEQLGQVIPASFSGRASITAATAKPAIDDLKGRGYEQVGTPKNSWGNEDGYRGVNSNWRDPRTGQVFEVQFHTPASFDAKELTHPLYEEWRLLDPASAQATALQAQQNTIFATVAIPAGAPGVGQEGAQ